MFRLLQILHAVIPLADSQHDRDEAFLAGSSDLPDLECRMRTLDERGRNPMGGIAVGLYAR